MLKSFTRLVFTCVSTCALAGAAFAQLPDSDVGEARGNVSSFQPLQNLTGDKVLLRTLDKITASTQDFTVNVGESLKFESLTIDVKHCEVKPPESIPETFAFLQVFEPPRLNAKERKRAAAAPEPVKIFSGWMLASKPAISALDHPVYDVWVVGCKGGEIT